MCHHMATMFFQYSNFIFRYLYTQGAGEESVLWAAVNLQNSGLTNTLQGDAPHQTNWSWNWKYSEITLTHSTLDTGLETDLFTLTPLSCLLSLLCEKLLPGHLHTAFSLTHAMCVICEWRYLLKKCWCWCQGGHLVISDCHSTPVTVSSLKWWEWKMFRFLWDGHFKLVMIHKREEIMFYRRGWQELVYKSSSSLPFILLFFPGPRVWLQASSFSMMMLTSDQWSTLGHETSDLVTTGHHCSLVTAISRFHFQHPVAAGTMGWWTQCVITACPRHYQYSLPLTLADFLWKEPQPWCLSSLFTSWISPSHHILQFLVEE